MLAEHLGDLDAAANLYFDVANAMPNDRRAAAAVVLHGSELSRWSQVASAMLQLAQGSERFDDELWTLAQTNALSRTQGEAFAHAIEAGLDSVALQRPVAAQFRYRLAQLRKQHLKDSGGAIVDLRRALELGGDRASWLSELAALERDGGASKPLLDALRRQSEAEPTNLNVLVEAADVASQVGDREQAVAILSQVLARAATAWRGTTQMQSDRPYDAVATWATEGLVDLHRAGRGVVEIAVEVRGDARAELAAGHAISSGKAPGKRSAARAGPSRSRILARALWSCDFDVPMRQSRIAAHSSCDRPSTSCSTRIAR